MNLKKIRPIDQPKSAENEPEVIKIARIGQSKLSNPETIKATREGIGELGPHIVGRYRALAKVLADPEKIKWQTEPVIVEELSAIAELILGTGSTEPDATPTARRAREVLLIAAAEAMKEFPATTFALVLLTNHSLQIGSLRTPFEGERGLTVEMPAGDPKQPTVVTVLCPLEKSAAIVGKYMKLSDDARKAHRREEDRKKNAIFTASKGYEAAIARGEGKTGCYVPKLRTEDPSLYFELEINGGFITVTDSVGGEEFIGWFVPLDSLKENRFSREFTEGLSKEQFNHAVKLRHHLIGGQIYARTMRERQPKQDRARKAGDRKPAPAHASTHIKQDSKPEVPAPIEPASEPAAE